MSACILLDVDKKTTWTDVRKNVCQESTLADLHETIHAMYVKQLSSYGRPSWVGSLANQPDGVKVSTTVVFATDSGGDEDKMKHIARDASTPNLFFFVICLALFTALVPLHRVTFAALQSKMSARMRYRSTIAKTIHRWRDQHKAVNTEWVQAFGVADANKHAKKCRHRRSVESTEGDQARDCQSAL